MLVCFRDVAAFEQILQKVRGKQRVAFGLAVNVRCKLNGKAVWRKRRIQVILNVAGAERIERDLLTQLVRLHLRFITLEWMIAPLNILGSECAGNQEPLVADTLA